MIFNKTNSVLDVDLERQLNGKAGVSRVKGESWASFQQRLAAQARGDKKRACKIDYIKGYGHE